jgi:hypothetical protein
VSAGDIHTCGLRTNGTLACWGYNDGGQATPPAGRFTQVSAGDIHTCGLHTNGTLACWGDNQYGQATPPAGLFVQVEAGELHTCGVTSEGHLTCWGNNDLGQVKNLTLLAPNGGQLWAVGSPQTIRWTSTGVSGPVRIQLSRDGGATWTALFRSTPNDGVQPWTVTGPAATQARIRVFSEELAAVGDSSDANLTLR